MKTFLLLLIASLFGSAPVLAEKSFTSIPSNLVAQYKNMSKLKPQQERIKAYEKIVDSVKELEQDLYDNPSKERPYDSVTVFSIQSLIDKIKTKGVTPEGCKVALKLIPYWSDPQLSEINDTSEPTQFTYAVVKSACKK